MFAHWNWVIRLPWKSITSEVKRWVKKPINLTCQCGGAHSRSHLNVHGSPKTYPLGFCWDSGAVGKMSIPQLDPLISEYLANNPWIQWVDWRRYDFCAKFIRKILISQHVLHMWRVVRGQKKNRQVLHSLYGATALTIRMVLWSSNGVSGVKWGRAYPNTKGPSSKHKRPGVTSVFQFPKKWFFRLSNFKMPNAPVEADLPALPGNLRQGLIVLLVIFIPN